MDVEAAVEMVAPVASEPVLADALRQTDLVRSLGSAPNVQVLRRGGLNFEPAVQGLRETQLAMVVDGTRTFAARPARMDSELSHAEPGNVESVQVISGPYALTEGAGAMAATLVRSIRAATAKQWSFGGRTGVGWRSNGSSRSAQTRIDLVRSNFGLGLRASGDLLDDYSAGGRRGLNALVPSDAATHQFGASLRYSPSPD